MKCSFGIGIVGAVIVIVTVLTVSGPNMLWGSEAVAQAPETTAEVTATPTPDPYAGLSVTELAEREYGAGEIEIESTLEEGTDFTRYLVRYPSEGLTVYGFMNVPRGDGPFPVVLVLHGYVYPPNYRTLAYTTRYADALASAGYFVFHPNYRDHLPSDADTERDLFRVGYAKDVLNLLDLVKTWAGTEGPLGSADGTRIGLWGHSMGGGIALRVATVQPDVQAVVLYGAMSGDERKNYERIRMWSGGQRGKEELAASEEVLQRVSPIHHLQRITAPVSIHHGERDESVPPEWSEDLCGRLQDLGHDVECFTYADQPHTFRGEGDQLFMRRMISFFDQYLKERPTES